MRIQKRKRSTFSIMMAFAIMVLMVFPTMAFADEGITPTPEETVEVTPTPEETVDVTPTPDEKALAAVEQAEESAVELLETAPTTISTRIWTVDESGNPVPEASISIYGLGTFPHGSYVDLNIGATYQHRVVNHGIVGGKLFKKIDGDGTDFVGYLHKMPIQAPYYKNKNVVAIYSVGTYQNGSLVTLPMGGIIQYRVLYEGFQSEKQYKTIDGTPLRATMPTTIWTVDEFGTPVPEASIAIYSVGTFPHASVVNLDVGKKYQYRVVNYGIQSKKLFKTIDGGDIVGYLDKMQIVTQDDLGNPVPDAAAVIYSVGTFKHGEYVNLPMGGRIQYRVVNHGIQSNKLYKKIDGTDLVGYLHKMPIQALYYKYKDVVAIYSVGTYQNGSFVTLPMGGKIQYRVLYEGLRSSKQYKTIDGTLLRAKMPTLIWAEDELGNPVPSATVNIYTATIGSVPHNTKVDLDVGLNHQYRIWNLGISSDKLYKIADSTKLKADLVKMNIVDITNPKLGLRCYISPVGTFYDGDTVTLPLGGTILQYRVFYGTVAGGKLSKFIDGSDLEMDWPY